MEFGKRIYELRKKFHMSQEQLAEKVGVSRQTISKWELGETSPDIGQAKSISQIFNVSLDELVGGKASAITEEKTTNTEKLAGLVIKILKIIGVCILVSIISTIIGIILFSTTSNTESTTENVTEVCDVYP